MKDVVPLKAVRRNGMTKFNYAKDDISISSTGLSHVPKGECVLKSPFHTQMSDAPTPTFTSESATFATLLSSGCILHTAIDLGLSEHTMMNMAKSFPIALTEIDEQGRYPIHVASAYGASSRVAALCVCSNPSSVVAKDVDNNTPLQLLCKGTWKGVWNLKFNPSAKNNMIDILEILYLKAPDTFFSEDSNGLGPIEQAINSNLDIKFIVALQEKISYLSKTKAKMSAHRKSVATRRESASILFPHAAHEA